MATKVLYIDDEIDRPPRTAQRIKDLLQVPNEFVINLRLPPKNFSELLKEPPDVLIVDLDLSTADIGKEPVSYLGSTLAAEMRVRNPGCPIVLVTRPQFLPTDGIFKFLEESADLDIILMKDDIITNPEEIRKKIQALARGFQDLNAVSGQEWQKVLNLMKADEDESNTLREAGFPITKGQWLVPKVARWIRNVVMGYPGILYDDLTAATRLGISLESFKDDVVQDLVKSAKYVGIFSDYAVHWWRDRLFGIAQELMIKHQIRGLASHGFSKAFSEEYGMTLSQATCVYDQTPVADWVCYVLQVPVKQQHSIPYYPDERPSIMDQARVSFTAILSSPNFDERLVDADGYAIVKKLWEIE